ncbi:MAG: hypothetical protein C0476_00335 [Sphingomonas sp.]|nr:hypothetical protein [Sphingomonas sp.]
MDAVSTQATLDDIAIWHRDGAVLLDQFFSFEEIAAVRADCDTLFAGRGQAGDAIDRKTDGAIGAFHEAQFRNQEQLPFAASPAINLIGLHPRLIAFAKATLGVDRVYLYQCDVWAKYTGEADYDQPFHCDFANHTLTVPSENPAERTVNCMIYVTDVTNDLGAIHYVANPDADEIVGRARLALPEGMQQALKARERSGAAPAGSVFAYDIDTYHRGTNLTRPGGHRYTITASFKAAGNAMIDRAAWPLHFMRPWKNLMHHASADQLACIGVPLPGDPFWTEVTIARTQARWPGWDVTPYRQALGTAPA